MIGFTDKTGSFFVYTMESGETKQVDRNPTSDPIDFSWSHDGRWLVYAKSNDDRSGSTALWVYNVDNGTKQRLTSGFFPDAAPVFDRKGEYVFFTSNRSFESPSYEDNGTTFIYAGTEVLMAMPLRTDVSLPFVPKSDEESVDSDEAKDEGKSKDKSGDEEKGKDADKKKDEKKEPDPFKIDFDGIEARCFALPVSNGNFGNVEVNDKGHLIYGRRAPRGGEGKNGIFVLDLSADKPEEKEVVSGGGGFGITPDGKKLLVSQGGRRAFIIDAAAGQKLSDAVPTAGMEVSIDPRAEWKQIFDDSWRVERDFFYDPNMHGVDWQGVHDHYSSMLADCTTRRDVSFLIREMISEINVGHAYYREGDVESADNRSVGLLGCRFILADGGWQISELYEGAAWDVDAKNPLRMAGVKSGQYLVAVNGIPVSTDESPYKPFLGKAGMTVTVTVSDDSKLDAEDKAVTVTLLRDDSELRFRNWIETNRKYVEEKSDGKIGYIYVTNTGIPGQNDLFRMFYGQIAKDALIVDERWNGGGQIPTRFIELLNRPMTNAWARRDGRDWIWPPDSHQGPKCMLANGMSGSGGDMFPALFKQSEIGPVIGTRTWGGLVGISGGPQNIDGSSVTAPTFAFYEKDGTWGIEGHGVDPNIEVIDDPAKMQNGGDPQLDVAIEEMLKAIKENGFSEPKRPAYPDRSKMGIKPEDK
ncbi:MAG: PDZ domain-containing protein [Pirellulaceae bacterium]